jgi:desulfoferrodoxin (superoxide reductase-like protein)
MFLKTNVNKDLSKNIYNELRKRDIKAKRHNTMVCFATNKNEKVSIDCSSGNVFYSNNDEHICKLIEDKRSSSNIYKCAVKNVDNILKKVDSEVKRIDLRAKKSIVDLRTKGFNKVIVFINKKLYENKSIFLAIKNFFFEEYEVEDDEFIEDYKDEYIETFGSAYKDDKEKEILIDKQTLKNLSYTEFYGILHNKYPEFYIQNCFTSDLSKNNRIIKRLAEKNYNKSAYDWVQTRADLLMKKEKMNSDMAYGIAWIQYKNEFCED